ncbi:hypothetical protein HN385_06295 [archaeon]|jgi:hypothetical protein|nr:hypothetical protein [archaeon]
MKNLIPLHCDLSLMDIRTENIKAKKKKLKKIKKRKISKSSRKRNR